VTRLAEEEMARVHRLRKEFAVARNTADAEPSVENVGRLQEQTDRRARAIRSLSRDAGMPVAELSAIFRCSKSTVRAAIREGQQQ
jgi:hypothetical protein